MMKLSSFASWNAVTPNTIADTGGSGAVWRIYEGQTAPLLTSFLKPVTAAANAAAKTYDGLAYSGGNGVTYSDTNAVLSGALAYTGASQGAINAGSYAITPTGLYSSQQGFDISFVNGALTINQASLAVTANDASRFFGAANPTFTSTITGYVNNEDATTAGVSGAPLLTTTADATTPVGTATIVAGAGSLTAANYAFTTFNNGVLAIAVDQAAADAAAAQAAAQAAADAAAAQAAATPAPVPVAQDVVTAVLVQTTAATTTVIAAPTTTATDTVATVSPIAPVAVDTGAIVGAATVAGTGGALPTLAGPAGGTIGGTAGTFGGDSIFVATEPMPAMMPVPEMDAGSATTVAVVGGADVSGQVAAADVTQAPAASASGSTAEPSASEPSSSGSGGAAKSDEGAANKGGSAKKDDDAKKSDSAKKDDDNKKDSKDDSGNKDGKGGKDKDKLGEKPEKC
jgi:hypothetical protein